MTAKHAKTPARAKTPAAAPTRSGLKVWQMDVLACIGIFLAVLIMFNQIALQGKGFSRGDDTEAAASWVKFTEIEASAREYPMWCPYTFAGFPSLAAGAHFNYDRIGMPYALAYKYLSPRYWADVVSIEGLFLGLGNDQSHGGRWLISLFLYGGLLTYLLMRRLGFGVLIAAFSGLLMAWNPYLVSLATAAHGGKLMTFIYMPLVILCAWNVMETRRLFDLALLSLALGWQIAVGGHTQILFYCFVTLALMYIVWAVMELRRKASLIVLKPALFFAIAGVLGLAVGAVWYIPLLEYLPYSIRGMAPAIAEAGRQAGYSMADATMWSMAPRELITFVVPSWFGLQSPYYWGDMPFTSSSFYFGIVPLLFAVLAFFGKKDRLFWGLVAVSVFSVLLSFGSHFESFYGFFFHALPYFNKFRTPALILLVPMLVGIIFAGYGIRFVLDLPQSEKWRKVFLYGMIACGALFLIFLVAGSSLSGLFGSFVKAGEDARYSAQQLMQLRDMRFGMAHTDVLVSLFFLAVAFLVCWMKVGGRLKANALVFAVLVLAVVDLGRFTVKFFDPQPGGASLENLRTNKIVETLRRDQSVFRVMPLGRLTQDNRWAAWEIASLGGYHGAKMRSYQDLQDDLFFNGPDRRIPLNMPALSWLNCKYFVAEGELPPALNLELVDRDPATKQVLYRNPQALERAYFADSILVMDDREATLRRIMQPDFMFDFMAITDKPLPGPVVFHPDRTARITEYFPHRVKIAVQTPAPALLVLSDAHYAPGWEATDNGVPTTIYKVNGFVRGVYVTQGAHTIEYRYTGKYEKRGVAVATISHFLVWGLVIGLFCYERKRRRERA